MIQGHSNLSFDNTEVAFKSKSNAALRKASLLFKSFDYPITLRLGPTLAKVTVAVGLKSIIKSTIFEQFCGGETIVECNETINKLAQSGIGTILDYSVEGAESDAAFNHTAQEILATIERAAGNSSIPFSVFKITGIVESRLLESVSQGKQLDFADQQKWDAGRQRFFNICEAAAKSDVRLFIDAEESWLQEAIDRLAEEERKRSLEMGYNDPIQVNKEATDRDYDLAVARCIENSHRVAICIGTHNETSSLKGTALMQAQQMPNQDTRVFFSQLLGMSDHISFNLSHHHYNVAKYVPYGPVSAVIPYLTRRAQENSGMAGQMGRELGLITNELHRRKSK
jgi:proline dehydrogenase